MDSQLIGYLAAAVMGIVLGLIGGGGSILTVPILVYLFRTEPILATAYSLFVVGLTALAGSVGYMRRGLVDFRAVAVFGLPSLAGVFLTRLFVIPAIPEVIWETSWFILSKGVLVMLFFSIMMVLAAIMMIRKPQRTKIFQAEVSQGEPLPAAGIPLAALEGLIVGGVTGFVGAGGGFLIVPALVFLLKLPVRKAIGTSLLVIAVKSLMGFTGDLTVSRDIDWSFLGLFTAVAVAGILLGVRLNRHVPASRLRPIFGWFVLATGLAILLREVAF